MAATSDRSDRVARVRRAFRRGMLVVGVVVLLATCYVGGPFLTLWRITRALDRADLDALQTLVDWSAVRQGLKDDIAEGVIGMPVQTLVASNTLPPFGASFIAGIAGTAVDRAVTPEGLLEAARRLDPPPGPATAAPFPVIVAAGFCTPTQFDLHLRAPGQDADEEPLHVRLVFRAGGWQVMRVWIPQDLMDRASPGS